MCCSLVLVQLGMRLATSKCKEVLQEWITVVSSLIVHEEKLNIAGRFSYLGSCMTKDDCTIVDLVMTRKA